MLTQPQPPPPDLQPPMFHVEQSVLTSDDYYTPRWIFDQMGLRFDLDVAAPPGGVPWVSADRWFTKADDGLSVPWTGRVWMNPPFSDTAPWVRRFIAHRHGVALLPTYARLWLPPIWEIADGVCLCEPLVFVTVTERRGDLPVMCLLAAFGEECVEAIGRIGHVR